jgi:hypothetical protein
MTLTQDARSLVVENGTEKMRFVFGSIAEQTALTGVSLTADSSWDGPRLRVVLTVRMAGSVRSTQHQTWSIGPAGELVIETTEHREGREDRTTKTVFTRARR